jgi:hypothetical protein
MTQRVIQTDEISLNSVRYPIEGPVTTVLASIYPSKVVLGDTTKDSQLRASVAAWGDFRGGIGAEEVVSIEDPLNRAWWSTLNLRHQGHLVMAPLTSDASADTTAIIGTIVEFKNEIYATSNDGSSTTLHKLTDGTDVWGSSIKTLDADATDSLAITLSGTDYMIIATTNSYWYSTDGTTGNTTQDTTNTKYLAEWDDRLWGIDDDGQLWWANVIGTEINDALLPLWAGNDAVADLFVASGGAGEPILYAATRRGLWAHDAQNSRFVQTELSLPFHPQAGEGCVRWRDSIYYPAGLGVYRYTPGASTTFVTAMGPDRDDGVPKLYKGSITGLIGSQNDLFAMVDGSAPPAEDLTVLGTESSIGDSPAVEGTGYSSIMAWNEQGWEVRWVTSNAQNNQMPAGMVSNAYSSPTAKKATKYRLYWAELRTLHYQQLPVAVENPRQLGTFSYAASGLHITPWFSAGQAEVEKLALRLKVEVEGASSSETVACYYALDGDDADSAWVQLTDDHTSDSTFTGSSTDKITGAGITTFLFGGVSAPAGTAFRSIRFKLILARGSDLSKSPDIRSTTLEFRKKLPAKWGHSVTVDLQQPYGGRSTNELRSALVDAAEATTLVEFTFRDDGSNERNYYVDVSAVEGLEFTGHNESGTTKVLLVEP